MNEVLLQASNLSKRFGALIVTNNVSINVSAGDRLALIGPNGAGKTTLISLLSGLLRPDAGQIVLAGRDITHDLPDSRVRQGLVRTFQINNVFGRLTVIENVYLAVSQHMGNSFRLFAAAGRCKDVLAVVEQRLEQVGLAEIRDHRVGEISYGRQRLVELAIALSLEPKVLLLDEPAAGMPESELWRLMEILEQLPKELAIILVEHDMQVVKQFASEVVVLVAGAQLTSGLPRDVMASELVREAYLGQSGLTRFSEG